MKYINVIFFNYRIAGIDLGSKKALILDLEHYLRVETTIGALDKVNRAHKEAVARVHV